MSDTTLETIIRKDRLDTALSMLRSLVDEAVLHIGSHGLRTAVVEPANVAMFENFQIKPGAFESTPDGSFPMGINLERLQDAISRADSSTPVCLSYDSETRKLRVTYDRVDIGMACIDPDSIRAEPDDVDMDLPNHFGINAEELVGALDTVDIVGDKVDIEVTEQLDAVRFYGEGDTDDAQYTIPDADLHQPELTAIGESMFSLDMLYAAIADPLSETDAETISVHLGDKFPIRASCEFFDGDGIVDAMVAPRIKTD